MLKKLKNPRNLVKAMRRPRFALQFVFKNLAFDYLYGSKTEYVMQYNGIKVRFSTTDKHSKRWFFPRYDKDKIHEPITTKLLMKSLKKTDTFVDVGAHLGYFTCIAAKFLTKGTVYGFEVEEHAFNLLEKNIKLNNLTNVKAYNYGVSDKDEFVEIPSIDCPNSGFMLRKNGGYNDSTTVKCISLDNLFKNTRKKPDVVKIDVEGAELSVLKGMQSLLKNKDLTLFLEIHGSKLHHFGTNSKEIVSFLYKHGYEVHEIVNFRSSNINKRVKFRKFESDTLIHYNTMCYVAKRN